MATLDELSEAYNESSVNIANSPTSISFLKPSTMSGLGAMPSGDIDVINNYDWTVTPANLRKDIPKLSMVEFEMDGNIRMSNIIYWARNLLGSVGKGAEDAYKGLYRAKPTGTQFIFPWFGDYHHTTSQSWQEFAGLGGLGFIQKLSKARSIMQGAPGVSINNPKEWKGSPSARYPYTIVLLNTVNDGAYEQNNALINRLLLASMHNQMSATLAAPPCLYSISIDGLRYAPVAVIESIQIQNLGVLRLINGITVPEAYQVQINIQELLPESRQIFAGVLGGSKVVAISENSDAPQAFEELRTAITTSGATEEE